LLVCLCMWFYDFPLKILLIIKIQKGDGYAYANIDNQLEVGSTTLTQIFLPSTLKFQEDFIRDGGLFPLGRLRKEDWSFWVKGSPRKRLGP